MRGNSALLVMPDYRYGKLLHHLRSLQIPVHAAQNCQQARKLLVGRDDTKVVITDVTLPDGNWCDILRYLVHQNIPANVIVASQLPDERLWSEVLWRGAYDLLVEPYDGGEVRRIVEGALGRAGSSEYLTCAGTGSVGISKFLD